MTVHFKTVTLTLTIVAIARVATINVTVGTNEARIAFCKRINKTNIYKALHYIKYPFKKVGIPLF